MQDAAQIQRGNACTSVYRSAGVQILVGQIWQIHKRLATASTSTSDELPWFRKRMTINPVLQLVWRKNKENAKCQGSENEISHAVAY